MFADFVELKQEIISHLTKEMKNAIQLSLVAQNFIALKPGTIGQPKNGEFENLLAFYGPYTASHPKTGQMNYANALVDALAASVEYETYMQIYDNNTMSIRDAYKGVLKHHKALLPSICKLPNLASICPFRNAVIERLLFSKMGLIKTI